MRHAGALTAGLVVVLLTFGAYVAEGRLPGWVRAVVIGYLLVMLVVSPTRARDLPVPRSAMALIALAGVILLIALLSLGVHVLS